MLKSDEGRTISYWEATESLIDRPLTGDAIDTEVCVIGGGLAGLTTAYLLTKAGRRVTVIDDGLIGGGETSRTTAHLSNAIDDRIYRIIDWHGDRKAHLAVQSHSRAIDEIESIVAHEGIECDFSRVDGYLFHGKEGKDDLEEELTAAHRCGQLAVKWVPKAPINTFDTGPCLKFPRQGQFHVLKYLAGLATAVENNGGRLISNVRVNGWTGGEAPQVKMSDGRALGSRFLVLATNYPLQSKMFAELAAYRTYAIGLRIAKNSIPQALFWDTDDPYHYVRIQPDEESDILIVGGEDHRTGQENNGDERFERLLAWARERFDVAGDAEFRWSGQCLETHDGLGFLGRYSESEPNIYLITGDSGMGMTHGTIGGMIVSDLIMGIDNPWTEVYDPCRIITQSLKEAIPEVVSSTVPYVDWLTGGDVGSVDEISAGEGAIIREGLHKIAVYRDEQGEVHRRSAVCTHLGCIVRFNTLEKTWDCPCHGSRFSVTGDPLNGPAISPLSIAGSEAAAPEPNA